MLELATLGLLQRESLHGYRLKQQLELFMSHCISVNYGSIYPLLKRLEEGGEIAAMGEEDAKSSLNLNRVENAKDFVKAARTCKIYSITAAGRDRWRQKMLQHPNESWIHSRSRFLIKFFFFSHLESAERVNLLEHRLMVCKLRLESPPPELITADPYQVAAWQYSRQVLQDEIQWLADQLSKEHVFHN